MGREGDSGLALHAANPGFNPQYLHRGPQAQSGSIPECSKEPSPSTMGCETNIPLKTKQKIPSRIQGNLARLQKRTINNALSSLVVPAWQCRVLGSQSVLGSSLFLSLRSGHCHPPCLSVGCYRQAFRCVSAQIHTTGEKAHFP